MKYSPVQNYIGGKFVDATSSRTLQVISPIDGNLLSTVPMSTGKDLDNAVKAAKAAFPAWSKMPIKERVQVFFRYKTLLEKNLKELAELCSEENGKTYSESVAEIEKCIELTEFATSLPQLVTGEILEVSKGVECRTEHVPLGVVASIVPFNFPAMVPLWMFPLALACGNTFVLKPSEKVPSCSLKMAELLKEAGLPDGVFNVITGDKEAVDALLTHPHVAAVSFVGSTAVAQHVYSTATAHGKRVQALGGAKNHALVMPDADMEFTADALVGAAYGSAGERCMAISTVSSPSCDSPTICSSG